MKMNGLLQNKKCLQKKYLLLFFFSFFGLVAMSQEQPQFDSTVLETQPLIKINKDGEVMKDVNMIVNMRFALNNDFANGSLVNSQFKMNDMRVEIIGKVEPRLFIRVRDVYTRSAGDAATTDLLRNSVDLAYIEYEATSKLTLSAGKMVGEFGGYEFFYNPITMVVYNDWLNDLFLSAVKAIYQLRLDQKFSFCISNSSSRSFNDNYGTTPGAVASKLPLGLTINWNGSFANGFSTKWSYSNFNLAKGENMNLLILGTRYKRRKLDLEYDLTFSNEALDRTGSVSRFLGNEFSNSAKDVLYVEHWLRWDYFFTPTISTTTLGMLNSSYWSGNPDISANKTDPLRRLWTVSTSLEFNLSKLHNIKLFVAYVGKFTNYSNYAKSHFGLQNITTGQILLGFMSQLVAL